FIRLRRELELAARNRGNHAFVDLLHGHVSHAPVDLSRTIKSIMNSTNITPGDLISLKRFYSCENPPATMYLCEYDLIIKIYATTINDTRPKLQQKDDVFKVQLVLKDLYTCLSTKTEVGSITAIVFDVIKRCIKHKTEIFAPEIQLTLQRTWVDRMLYLVQLHYTLPVLKYFGGVGRELDDSLIVHFVKKVLSMAIAPYTVTFVEHMVHIVEPLVENLTLIKDVQQLVINFLGKVLYMIAKK
ncbi:hypothetical protein EDC94DRAFT_513134, partial [Helicostylum pulchrum]